MRRTCFALLAMLLLCAPAAWGQAWPSRPLHWIVPVPPGGAPDIIARHLAPRLAARLGQPVIVENRPGAEHNVAMQQVAQSGPEGYVLLHALTGLVTSAHLYKLAFDPLNDFAPVAQIANTEWVLLVRNGLEAKSVQELVALARSRPARLSCASSGGLPEMACRMLASVAGAELLQVPYKGSVQALADMLGERVDVRFEQSSSALPLARQGRLRALASLNSQRGGEDLGDLPALAETYPGFSFVTWQGIVLRTGTPSKIVARLDAELQAAIADEDVQRALRAAGIVPAYANREEFAALIRRDSERYGSLIRKLGMRVQQ